MADVPFPRGAAPEEALREALDALAAGRPAVLATVIARHGSAPSTPGQKLALVASEAGPRAVGTVGGGAVEHAVLRAMMAALDAPDGAPRTETFRLGPSLGMCCGGSATMLLEPLRPSIAVLVVGAGHVGAETAPLLARLGFRVTLVDGREDAARARQADEVEDARAADAGEHHDARGPNPGDDAEARAVPGTGALRVVHADHDDPEVLAALGAPPGRAFCVVMTHDHQLDQEVVGWALARGFAFVGGVGSRAKAARTRERLRARGVAEADVERVRMPVGVDIGARRPAEIAVAIAAELVRLRAAREGLARPVRDVAGREAAE